MNFKPSLWKVVVSLLVGIVADYYISSKITCKMGVSCSISQFMLNPINLALSLIPLIIVYIIWSFFQRRDRYRRR